MKVYYNGFNLYRQFPSAQDLVSPFVDFIYLDTHEIEVSYHYIVLLVADTVVLQGGKNQTVQIANISRIHCNENTVLVLLTNGDVVKISNSVTKLPKLMELCEDDYIARLSYGSKLAVASTKNGHLYSIPNKLEFVNNEIVDLQTGREHCLILDQEGKVFTFGRGSRGQLGHGCLDDEPEPRFVEALGGIRIEAIAAGAWHSCAVSAEGDLYVWGWNGNGQLGLSEREEPGDDQVSVMATPQPIDLQFNVEMVGCGSRHTVVLANDGKLHGCGWNKYKQLKDSMREAYYNFVCLGDFSKEKVRQIKCGPWNTLVICEE